MQTAMIKSTKHNSFAVIRSYQPTRIERDLLAQVFDLAQRGLPDSDRASVADRRTTNSDAAKVRLCDKAAMGNHADAPEAVA